MGVSQLIFVDVGVAALENLQAIIHHDAVARARPSSASTLLSRNHAIYLVRLQRNRSEEVDRANGRTLLAYPQVNMKGPTIDPLRSTKPTMSRFSRQDEEDAVHPLRGEEAEAQHRPTSCWSKNHQSRNLPVRQPDAAQQTGVPTATLPNGSTNGSARRLNGLYEFA